MAYATAGKNVAVDAVAAAGRWISLHTASPGTTGASEAAGVTRQQTTWPAASGGITTGSEVTFAGIAAAAYTHFGVWSAVSAGTFYHGDVLSPGMTLNGVGTLKVTPKITFP